MLTTIYKNENSNSDELCVDITEILYNILNQVYNFTKIIKVNEIKDIAKISNTTAIREAIYINASNYTGSLRTVLRKLNVEAFINITTTLVIVIPTSLLKFTKENTMNVEVEYVPKTLILADTEISIEDDLAIVIFNPNNYIRGDLNEY
ncbi:TPA: hypothetical protein KNR75_003788 [Clostridioides difficile]|nr:hypothetical protein [Clostridioides difficile]